MMQLNDVIGKFTNELINSYAAIKIWCIHHKTLSLLLLNFNLKNDTQVKETYTTCNWGIYSSWATVSTIPRQILSPSFTLGWKIQSAPVTNERFL